MYAPLLQQAASFRQSKHSSTFNNAWHSIGERKTSATPLLRLPSNIANVLAPSNDIRTDTNSNVCLSASSTSKVDLRPDTEKVGSTITQSLRKLCSSGSDIRGRFVDHDDSIHSLVAAIQENEAISSQPALTPFAAHCIGYSYASAIAQSLSQSSQGSICIGVDPRTHGVRLAEAFACGIRAYLNSDSRNSSSISLAYTGAATTPACASFVRSKQCSGSVVRIFFMLWCQAFEKYKGIMLTMLANSI